MSNKLNVIIFCLLLSAFFALIFIFPPDAKASATENRVLQSMPELSVENIFSGNFSRDYENYISDSVGFRSDLIIASKAIKLWEGFSLPDEAEIVIVASNDAGEDKTDPSPTPGNQASDPTHKPERQTPVPSPTTAAVSYTPQPSEPSPAEPESSKAPQTEEPTAYPEPEQTQGTDNIQPIKSGPLLKFKDRLMEIYGFNKPRVKSFAEAINSYRESLSYRYRIFTLVAPTQIEFIDEKYKSVTDSERDSLDYIKENLGNGIHFVDVYDKLKEHSDEYLYFKTDHHWTALGAYYAYTVFCEEAGFEPLSLEKDYDAHRLENFLGYLYNSAPSDYLAKNPDYIEYYTLKEPVETSKKILYPPGANDKTTYSIFMGGDWNYYNIETSVKNGRTAIIVKDSYANAFIPFLVPHYERIVIIDPRRYGGGLLNEIKKYDNADLIFADYVFATGMSDYVKKLNSIK